MTRSTPARDPELPDKGWLFGNYDAHRKWMDRLHRRATYKALDMADDDENVQITSNRGLTWRELAVIGAMVLGGAALAARTWDAPHAPQQPTPTAAGPVDSDYEVRFYDAAGRLIEVPHIDERTEATP